MINKYKLSNTAKKVGKSLIVLLETLLICVYIHNAALLISLFMVAPYITDIVLDYLIPFAFYCLTNQQKANQLKTEMMEKLRLMFTIDGLSKFFSRLVLGAMCGVSLFAFNVYIFEPMLTTISAYLSSSNFFMAIWEAAAFRVSAVVGRIFTPFWIALTSRGCTGFRNSVFISPLWEEVAFRGVVQNSIKFLLNLGTLCSVFIKNSLFSNNAQDPQLVTVQRPVNANEVNSVVKNIEQDTTDSYSATTHDEVDGYVEKTEKISVVTTALLFSMAHPVGKQPTALSGGLLYGVLHEREDNNDFTLSASAHMSYNFMCNI